MTHFTRSVGGFCAGLGVIALVSGCGSSTVNSTATASEMAESSLSGALNSTEPGGTQSLDGLSEVLASSAACPTLLTTTCSNTAGGEWVMTYSTCSFGSSATVWNGSQTVADNDGCPTGTIALSGLNTQTLTRTFGAGSTETTSAGVVTTLDTTTASSSGWSSSVTVGNGMTATFSGTAGNRTLTIQGLHLHGVTSGGATQFDVTVTSSGISVLGAGTSRTVPVPSPQAPVMTVQHNDSKYTASVNITTPLAYTLAGCCHPTSGVFTTQLSGSLSGTETLTFNGDSCGSATYQDPGGHSTAITLTHCF